MSSADGMPADLENFDISTLIETPHNKRLYNEVQKLKGMVKELVDFQLAHPMLAEGASPEELAAEKAANNEIHKREKYVRAQLAVIKGMYRQSVLKVREEKAKTADAKTVNDALILGLHNLKYEEQSLRSEISAAENFE
jgi:THO complex subunit 5